MLTGGVRNMISKLDHGVRPLKLRPLEAAKSWKEIPAESDARQPTCIRPADTRVQTITRRRAIQIAWQRRLIETAVAESSFVDPTCVRSPDPIAAGHLRASVNVREPFLLQFRKVFHGSSVVTKKIHATDGLVRVDAEIYFGHSILYADVVIKSVRDVDGRIVVRRETAAVAADGCIRRSARQRTSRNLQAGWTNGNSARLQISDHIRDAVGAVSRSNEQAGGVRRHGHHRRAGDSTERVRDVVHLTFVGAKEKSFVLDDRSANAATILLERARQLRIGH